jgi:hypothetical protein
MSSSTIAYEEFRQRWRRFRYTVRFALLIGILGIGLSFWKHLQDRLDLLRRQRQCFVVPSSTIVYESDRNRALLMKQRRPLDYVVAQREDSEAGHNFYYLNGEPYSVGRPSPELRLLRAKMGEIVGYRTCGTLFLGLLRASTGQSRLVSLELADDGKLHFTVLELGNLFWAPRVLQAGEPSMDKATRQIFADYNNYECPVTIFAGKSEAAEHFVIPFARGNGKQQIYGRLRSDSKMELSLQSAEGIGSTFQYPSGSPEEFGKFRFAAETDIDGKPDSPRQ